MGGTGRTAPAIRATATAAANTIVMPARPSRWWFSALGDPLRGPVLFAATAAVKESVAGEKTCLVADLIVCFTFKAVVGTPT